MTFETPYDTDLVHGAGCCCCAPAAYDPASVADLDAYDPFYGAPVYEPVYDAPVYEAPVYEAPVYEAPVYEAPVYEAPVYVPVVVEPVVVEPVLPAPAPVDGLVGRSTFSDAIGTPTFDGGASIVGGSTFSDAIGTTTITGGGHLVGGDTPAFQESQAAYEATQAIRNMSTHDLAVSTFGSPLVSASSSGDLGAEAATRLTQARLQNRVESALNRTMNANYSYAGSWNTYDPFYIPRPY